METTAVRCGAVRCGSYQLQKRLSLFYPWWSCPRYFWILIYLLNYLLTCLASLRLVHRYFPSWNQPFFASMQLDIRRLRYYPSIHMLPAYYAGWLLTCILMTLLPTEIYSTFGSPLATSEAYLLFYIYIYILKYLYFFCSLLWWNPESIERPRFNFIVTLPTRAHTCTLSKYL